MPAERRGPWSLLGRRAEGEALGRIVAEWRETLDSIEWPILALDPAGRVARLNRAAQRLAGLEFGQILGRPVESIGSWQPWREIADMASTVAASRTGLSRHVAGERGKAWHLSATFSPDASGREGRIIVVARDVTEVARLEGRLRHSETMATMGTLVSGVAHEVRNPLFAISATADALEARLGPREDLAPFLTTLRGEVDRLGRLMRDLLDYGKAPVLDLREVDVGEVVASAARACEPLASRRQVAIRNRVGPHLAVARLDPGRVAQAVGNLVENALHFSPAGGSVEIEGAASPAGEKRWVEISVADHGPGLSAEDLSRMFDPFYSRRRGGTGLGLSIVRRIAEAHGGSVVVGNGAAGGAILTLSLPM